MNVAVIPTPAFLQKRSDEPCFKLTRLIEIKTEKGCEKAEKALIRFIENHFEGEILGTGKEEIRISMEPSSEKAEAYTLKSDKSTVTITACGEAGAFYAVQTLIQLLLQNDMCLPELFIEDFPRFPVRGFMLDCGRYFFTVDAVKHFIDMAALHKLNEFHWHLSDDQGFRCQLESRLLLTEIGSYRSHTNFNTIAHEGYYTKAEMKEIINYAHEKCMRVIPEIDTPGHAVSMIAAYPFLSCFNRELTVATSWGVKHDVICVGKETTFEFMEKIFDELCEIFTDGIIHLGGDEVPVTRWKICPHCQKRMKDEGMKDERELHAYYLQRIADHLKKSGAELRMWNDCQRERMVDSSVTWQQWNSEMSESEAADEINKGRKFIVSDSQHYYLDLPYGQVNLKSVYEYEPVFKGVKKENEKNIIGVEACLWTEFVPTMERAEYCIYPRLAAVSETAWTSKENRDYNRFHENLGTYYQLLNYFGIEPAALKAANPKGTRKLASRVYWERRKLCWGGLHNVIDNFAVKKKYGK